MPKTIVATVTEREMALLEQWRALHPGQVLIVVEQSEDYLLQALRTMQYCIVQVHVQGGKPVRVLGEVDFPLDARFKQRMESLRFREAFTAGGPDRAGG